MAEIIKQLTREEVLRALATVRELTPDEWLELDSYLPKYAKPQPQTEGFGPVAGRTSQIKNIQLLPTR